MKPVKQSSRKSEKPELAELVKISNAVGKDTLLVLGGGGNTSVKTADGKYMYVKASGTALKNMTERLGWRRLKLDSALAILKDKSTARTSIDKRETEVAKALLSACDDEVKANTKPSIESCFHSILDRYVIHLHPVAVLAYVCAKNGRTKLEKLFKQEKPPPLWVPYTDPGYMLAKKIKKLVSDYRNQYDGKGPVVIFLQNHGLVITAKNADLALQLVRKVVDTCNSRLKQPKVVKVKTSSPKKITEAALAIHKAFLQATGKDMTVRHFIDEDTAGFMARDDAARLCTLSPVTPDELIYAHGSAMWLDKWDRKTILNKLNRQIADGRKLPAGFLIKPMGLFIIGSEKQLPLVKDVISTYLRVRSFAASLGKVRSLNKRQQDFIARLESG
jgi:rhamnose utilization protein RhaD (predicted bifunctional aldolase and dehydrogenase)